MLTATVRLRFGIFDAGSTDDPRRPEWPPHPARLFCALVAGDPEPGEWAALRWLEAQDPPEVNASAALDETAHEQFLVNNAVGGNNPNTPGRSPGIRIKPRLVPGADRFSFVWPNAVPPPDVLAALRSLAWRVPYVGRATSDAEVSIDDQPLPEERDVVVLEPASVRDGEFGLRVPYAGYCDRLIDAHEAGRSAWEESRWTDYRPRPAVLPEPVPVHASPFGGLITLAIERRSHLHGSHLVPVTDAMRNTAISRLDGEMPVPAAVSGHGADGRNHVAFLALPNVGVPDRLPGLDGYRFRVTNPNAHADGRIMGVGVAVPDGDAEARSAIARLLVDRASDPMRLTLGRNGVLDLAEPANPRPWALAPSRWTAPSRIWVTATPLVLDRFPKRADRVDELVMDAVETAGFPRPEAVHVRKTPMIPGGIHMSRSQVQRRAGAAVRPWFHAWILFAVPVSGPVLVGSMRYRGLGLCAPLPEPRPLVHQGTALEGVVDVVVR